ncbi:MAG: hypothetical protein AAB320_02465 [Elusimicrobiota bacterium]
MPGRRLSPGAWGLRAAAILVLAHASASDVMAGAPDASDYSDKDVSDESSKNKNSAESEETAGEAEAAGAGLTGIGIGAGETIKGARTGWGSVKESAGAGLTGIGIGVGDTIKGARTKTSAPTPRGASGSSAAGDPRSDPAAPGARPAAESSASGGPVRQSSERALKRADAMAGALRSNLSAPDGLPGASGRPPAPSDGNASRPGTDLLSLASSGYAPAIKAMGYRFGNGPDGRPSVLKTDGTVATNTELDALRSGIQKLPGALSKRPDFFQVINPESYERIKDLRPESGALPVFKDINLSPGRRDLLWTRSCAAVSGDCNPAAAELFYRVSDFVSPETLKNIGDWLDGVADEEAARPAAGRQGAPAGTKRKLPLLERLLAALTPGDEESVPAVIASEGPRASAAPAGSPPKSLRSVEPEAPGLDGGDATEGSRRKPWLKILLASAGLTMAAGAAVWRARR